MLTSDFCIADMSATGGYPVTINCVLLTASARVPRMGSPFSVGYDLFSSRPVTIDGYDRVLISTGLCLDIPCGFYGCVYPRSSLVLYSNVSMVPYCLDADARYVRILVPPPTLDLNSIGRRGEVKLLMVNLAATPYHVSTANPVAQVVVLPYMAATFREVSQISETIRGTMSFERTRQHVASTGPSGPMSPLMSPHSLFGELFPRYICCGCRII